MANRTIKKLIGLLSHVLVKVTSFIFLADFVILDGKVHIQVPTIFARPFLATNMTFDDKELG